MTFDQLSQPNVTTTTDQQEASTRPTVLELRRVACCYEPGRFAIQDISISASEGDIICLLGPSGCGKTTVLRVIAGFEPVSAGEVYLNGQLVSARHRHIRTERRRVGMVFQDYALFPHLRVADNIAFGLQQLPSDQRRDRVQKMLGLIGLKDLEQRYPHELSGGQQQRVALARALAPHPVILLLDEPFSNLDPDMTFKMRKELHDLLIHTKTTATLVTHDHEEAFSMADRVAVLQDGHLAQFDTPEAIYHTPASPFVAEFVGQADFIPGVIHNGTVLTEIGEFPKQGRYQGDPHVMVMIRPDDVRIVSGQDDGARIVARQFRGSENLYTIGLSSGHIVHGSEPSTNVYPIGTPVELEIIATHTVLFERSPDQMDERRNIV